MIPTFSRSVNSECSLVLRGLNSSRLFYYLTHWGRVTLICVGKLTIIGSDNSLSSGRRQAILWTNTWILLIGTLGTNFIEILTEIHIFSFKKMRFKMSSGKLRPLCLGRNVLSAHIPFVFVVVVLQYVFVMDSCGLFTHSLRGSFTATGLIHYSDVIMNAMASQIYWRIDCFYSTVCWGADEREHNLKPRVTSLCEGNLS